MRGPKPPVVELSPEEQQGLETLVRRYRHPPAVGPARQNHSVCRGWPEQQPNSPRKWAWMWIRYGSGRNRWLGLQAAILEDLSIEERLRDAPRPGAPARITPEQVCQIMSLACEAPSQCGRPISQWTSRELADEIIEKGIVERISPRHAARLLERGT